MNPLNKYPKIREIFLGAQWVVNGVHVVGGALFAFMFGPNPTEWPIWFLGSLAITPVLWAYLGLTAQGNVTGTDAEGYPITTEGP